jgi:aminoglycoside 2'-N-acetyltransferase I
MDEELTLIMKKNRDLSEEELENIITLCSNAFNEDFRPYMKEFTGGTHLLGYYEGTLVSHLLWLSRWVRIENIPLLKTAFLDAVAVDEKYRKRGFASSTMTRFADEITDYDIAALTTESPDFYKRLGWQAWQGSVSFRRVDDRVINLTDSKLMVLSLPRTPVLDLNEPLTVEWKE